MICSIISFSFWLSFNLSSTRLSPSISLEASNLMGISAASAWSSIRCIIAWIHLCTAVCSLVPCEIQKSCLPGHSLYFAICNAWSVSSSIPSFLAAEIGMTGTPSSCSISFTSTLPPFLRTSSIILSATTIGMSSSINCIVKYRFLSILEASIILIIPFGFSSNKNFLVTISSLL